jgi:hypothetical protein
MLKLFEKIDKNRKRKNDLKYKRLIHINEELLKMIEAKNKEIELLKEPQKAQTFPIFEKFKDLNNLCLHRIDMLSFSCIVLIGYIIYTVMPDIVKIIMIAGGGCVAAKINHK